MNTQYWRVSDKGSDQSGPNQRQLDNAYKAKAITTAEYTENTIYNKARGFYKKQPFMGFNPDKLAAYAIKHKISPYKAVGNYINDQLVNATISGKRFIFSREQMDVALFQVTTSVIKNIDNKSNLNLSEETEKVKNKLISEKRIEPVNKGMVQEKLMEIQDELTPETIALGLISAKVSPFNFGYLPMIDHTKPTNLGFVETPIINAENTIYKKNVTIEDKISQAILWGDPKMFKKCLQKNPILTIKRLVALRIGLTHNNSNEIKANYKFKETNTDFKEIPVKYNIHKIIAITSLLPKISISTDDIEIGLQSKEGQDILQNDKWASSHLKKQIMKSGKEKDYTLIKQIEKIENKLKPKVSTGEPDVLI